MAKSSLLLPTPMYPDIATYMEKTGDTQANMRQTLNIEQAHLSRIISGQIVPRPELAWKLAAYCKIPLDSFMRTYLAKKLKREEVA